MIPKIETNDISAEISASGSVTFSDPPPQFTKQQVDRVLRDVQLQTGLLAELEQDVGRSKEFLSKVRHWICIDSFSRLIKCFSQVVKSNDSWAPAQDEELFANLGPQAMWDENVY